VVIRTVALGHPFTQGTADSNEVWVDFAARSGGRVLGRSGALADEKDDSGPLDEWAHRINVLMLDRHGNRINRRNPQDIFTPLYNHQIPPGAGQVVHYRLKVPEDVKGPVELSVRVRYRKFDHEYMELVYGKGKVPKLPVVDLCSDRVVLPVKGVPGEVPPQTSPIKPAWQRWNDYGIGCLLEGGPDDKKGELRQAAEAFQQLLKLDEAAHVHAHINLARVYIKQGLFSEAARALNAAREDRGENKPWWTIAWLNGLVNLEHAEDFDAAIKDFESILDPKNQPRDRRFDFSLDYIIINDLARAYFKRAQLEGGDPAARDPFLLRAIELYERTLQIDPEDVPAYYGLHQCYRILGRAAPKVSANEEAPPPTDEAGLVSLGRTVRNDREAKAARLEAAARLARGVTALREEPVSAEHPKRARVDILLGQMRPYFHEEKDPELRAAAAAVLSALNLEAHAIFKPDELAESFTAQKYRAKHPAADHAAEAIVIYDLR
jgi:tetratricopeptide (TPR) repeat protein